MSPEIESCYHGSPHQQMISNWTLTLYWAHIALRLLTTRISGPYGPFNPSPCGELFCFKKLWFVFPHFIKVAKVFPLVTMVLALVTKVFPSVTKVFPLVTRVFLLAQGIPFGQHGHGFSGTCGQLAGLCPTSLFHSLRHGCHGLIEVFSFLSFFYSPRSITTVLYFSHQGLSLW